jgi:hypothetical protein
MPDKNREAERIGGPGSSHQNPDKPASAADQRHGPEPHQKRSYDKSDVSGGGGEQDRRHSHDPAKK